MSSEKELAGSDEPPPYETILDIPNWKDVPAPPTYDGPSLQGIYSDPAYPPPPYTSTPPTPALPKLAYADFLPKCTFPGDALQPPVFDDMKILMTIVNQWLQGNPQYVVIRCESIERKIDKDGVLETGTTIRHQGTYTLCHYVRGIRLWLSPNTSNSPPQQLWYMNIVPQLTPIRVPVGMSIGVGFGFHAGPVMAGPMMYGGRFGMGMMAFPVFEDLDKVLEKLNKKLKKVPIPGEIVTIESIDTKYAEGFNWKTMDADCCTWSEKGGTNKLFLTMLRIFFVIGRPENAEIDIVDFAPLCLDAGTSVTMMPKFEPYTDALQRANAWIAQQKDKKITNVQTVTTKLVNNIFMGHKEYNLKKMDFTLGFSDSTFIKVLRVPYIKTSCSSNPCLTSKAFVPVRFSYKMSETTSQTIQRVNDWLNCTGANVIGVDTLEYEFSPQSQRAVNTENVRTTLMARQSHHWISTIRLYLDGSFEEPPPEVFPPIPAYIPQGGNTTESSCCTIL